MKQWYPLSPLLFDRVLKVLAIAIKEEENEGDKIGKDMQTTWVFP